MADLRELFMRKLVEGKPQNSQNLALYGIISTYTLLIGNLGKEDTIVTKRRSVLLHFSAVIQLLWVGSFILVPLNS